MQSPVGFSFPLVHQDLWLFAKALLYYVLKVHHSSILSCCILTHQVYRTVAFVSESLFLVVVALAAGTRGAGRIGRSRDIYAGAIAAIFASIALAWAVNHLITDDASGHARRRLSTVRRSHTFLRQLVADLEGTGRPLDEVYLAQTRGTPSTARFLVSRSG